MQTEQNFLILPAFFISNAFNIGAWFHQIQILMMRAAMLLISRNAEQICPAKPEITQITGNNNSGIFIGNPTLYPRIKTNNTLRAFRLFSDNSAGQYARSIGNGLYRMRTKKMRKESHHLWSISLLYYVQKNEAHARNENLKRIIAAGKHCPENTGGLHSMEYSGRYTHRIKIRCWLQV